MRNTVFVNQTALTQIIINLVANATKYNDKEIAEIQIGTTENDVEYHFYVQDNGPGIDPKYHEKIFRIFEVCSSEDKYGKKGNGIGLATVKKMIEHQGGKITVDSAVGQGARFSFSIRK